MKRILVLGAGGSAGINFIDSLRMDKDEEYYIAGTDTNKWHLELPEVDVAYHVPSCTSDGYFDLINRIIEKEQIEFVHPQPDIEVLMLSRNRDIVNAKTFLPAHKTIELCQDKMACNEHLRKNRLSVPLSFNIADEDDLRKKFEKVKDRTEKVWVRAKKGAGSKAALPVKEVEQAISWVGYWKSMRDLDMTDFMISEFLPGREYAFQSIWNDGELITSLARERLEYIFGNLTPSGQSSSPSVASTVHEDDLNDIAEKTMTVIDKQVTGVHCIDIKRNDDGIPCIMEINAGRFFTTSNFFAAIGANMPRTYLQLGYGIKLNENISKFNSGPKGQYWIRLMDKGPALLTEDSWRSKDLV